ncbi:MAG: PIN domain-containing protein [Fibrobacteraceae bacterium]|nr:PIN domain-containing protein [Fibrobacteraceae bacterium]
MVLVDTSVWIDYFRSGNKSVFLEPLVDSNEVCVNDLILAELIPSIRHRKEVELENLLLQVHKISMNIDWTNIISMQVENLRHGINRVGIPDLIIAQNAMQNNLTLYSLDKHFTLMKDCLPLKLFEG